MHIGQRSVVPVVRLFAKIQVQVTKNLEQVKREIRTYLNSSADSCDDCAVHECKRDLKCEGGVLMLFNEAGDEFAGIERMRI